MRRYGFTIVACAIVGVLAMVMTGAAAHEEDPPPIELYEASPEPVATSAPARKAGKDRADRLAREARRSSRRDARSRRREAASAAAGPGAR